MIKVLASGSTGNCYVIQAGDERLLLECGIDYKNILKGLNYNINGVKGCLITHKHLDHCRSIKRILENIPKIYAPLEVLEKFNCKNYKKAQMAIDKEKFKLGGFTIMPFKCQHTNSDTTKCENLGYLIQHDAMGKVLFATDTYYLKYIFKNVDHILIECNYSEETIQALEPHEQRVFKSHMSLETLKDTLKTWNLRKTKTITLIHVSKNNGDPMLYKAVIESITGIPTFIAASGLEIE